MAGPATHIQRDIPFPGGPDELRDILRDYAKVFDCVACRPRSGPGIILTAGSHLALHPSEIRWKARAVLGEGTLRIAADVATFPWSRARCLRILRERMDQLIDFIETKLRGGAAEKFGEPAARRPFAPVGRGIQGICAGIAANAAQMTAGMLLAFAVSLLLGLVVADQQIAALTERAQTLDEMGLMSLPSLPELEGIDGSFRLGVAALLVLPIVFLVGFSMGLAHVVGDVWALASRAAFWVWAFLVLLLFFCLWGAVPPHVAVGCAILIPTAAQAGNSAVWSLRRYRRREPAGEAAQDRRRRAGYIAAAVVVVLILAVGLAPSPERDYRDALVTFRDRYLLSGSGGRALVDFYYRHTRYAAEAVKPVFVDPYSGKAGYPQEIRTVMLCSGNPVVLGEAAAEMAVLGLAVDRVPPVAAQKAAAERNYDLYVIDRTFFGKEILPLKEKGALDRLLLLLTGGEGPLQEGVRGVRWDPQKADVRRAQDLSAALAAVAEEAFPGASLSELSYLAWLWVSFGAPLFLVFVGAGVFAVPAALLYRKAPVAWAHGAVAAVFLAAVGGAVAIVGAHAEEVAKVGEVRRVGAAGAGRLADFLGDPLAEVRYEAAFRAWQLLRDAPEARSPALHDALLKRVNDDDVRVRIWACGALGKSGDERAVPALLERIAEEDYLVRYRAAGALGDLRERSAVEALRGRICGDDWYVGGYALGALRRIDPANILQWLRK